MRSGIHDLYCLVNALALASSPWTDIQARALKSFDGHYMCLSAITHCVARSPTSLLQVINDRKWQSPGIVHACQQVHVKPI